jgi:hypothetical protein
MILSPLLDARGRRRDYPVAPADIADAVEVWARGQGRRSRLEWDVEAECFVIRLSRPASDPVLAAVHAGRVGPDLATENVHLRAWAWDDEEHRRGHFEPYRLDDFGATKLIELLDRGNTASGRGEFNSIEHYITATVAANRQRREDFFNERMEAIRERVHRHRRRVLGLPWMPVTRNIVNNTRTQ